jgi:hypothetical protein
LAARLLLESRPFSGGVWSIFIGRNPPTHTPSSISNTRLIDGVPLPTLMGFTTFVAHYDFYTIMDQIHLSPLVDKIQLALGRISNRNIYLYLDVEHAYAKFKLETKILIQDITLWKLLNSHSND